MNTFIYAKKCDAEKAVIIVKYFNVIKRKLAFCTWVIAEDPESIYPVLQLVRAPFTAVLRILLMGFCTQKQLLKYFPGSATKERRGHHSFQRRPDYV